MHKTLTVAEVNALGSRLRSTRDEPVAPPAKNEAAEALKMVAAAIAGMKQPEPTNHEPLIAAFKALMAQHRESNAELIEALREALEPREEIAEVQPPAPPEEWDFKIIRDRAGRIDSVKARKCT